ncbi:hypothetical protein HanIR_Chr16g0815471 [Helianthus annuus]|nr:hypothetical protein HanIR_Chr16g0815471 [Helianthus annuus]
MENPNPTEQLFTSPEMQAALHLIQLSGGESDGHGFSYTSGEVLTASFKRRRRRTRESVSVCDRDESQGSCTSDVTSGRRNGGVRRFVAEDDGDDVAGRKKKKKFRSIVEIYKISWPLF